MIITTDSWHYKVFDWWFKENHYGLSYDQYFGGRCRLGLCPYFRAVVFYAPFQYLCTRLIPFLFTHPRVWVTVPVVGAILTELNYHFYGKSGLKMELDTAMIIIITTVGLYALKLWYTTIDKFEKKKSVTSFIDVVSKYVESIHRGVCPFLTFIDPEVKRTGTELP